MAWDQQITYNKDCNALNKFSPWGLKLGSLMQFFSIFDKACDWRGLEAAARQQGYILGIIKLRFWKGQEHSSRVIIRNRRVQPGSQQYFPLCMVETVEGISVQSFLLFYRVALLWPTETTDLLNQSETQPWELTHSLAEAPICTDIMILLE